VLRALLVIAALGPSCRSSTEPDQPSPFRELWFAPSAEWSTARPTVVGSSVIFANGTGGVESIDRADGTRRWSTVVIPGQRVRGYALVHGGGVVVAPLNAEAVGLDATSGAELWRFRPPDDDGFPGTTDRSTPAADDTHAYIPAWGASVSAVNLATGSADWVWSTPDSLPFRSGATGVTLSGDTVYASVWVWLTQLRGGPTEPWLVAIDRRTGAELWREVLDAPVTQVPVFSAPVVSGNVVLMNLVNGQVFAYDRFQRTRIWRSDLPVGPAFAVVNPPVVVGDTVFSPLSDGAVEARLVSTGSVLWREKHIPGPVRLFIAGDFLVSSAGANFVAINRRSGRARWRGVAPPKGVPTSLQSIGSAVGTPTGQVYMSIVGGHLALEPR